VTELTLFADYHQIHAFDEGSEADLGDAWTDRAVADHLAVSADAVAVGTAVNVDPAASRMAPDLRPGRPSTLG
jgi:hypothetical protein